MALVDPSDAHEPGEATQLLKRLSAGDSDAQARLLPLLYNELKRTAAGYMRRERDDHTLQPTALVHEAWMRLTDGVATEWQDRGHFLRLAARAMRNILVDHARARATQKRASGGEREPLDGLVESFEQQSVDVLALNQALESLAGFDEPLAHLVELRFFGGLTIEETARALDVSTPTIERRWRVARMWLRRELGDDETKKVDR